MELIYKQNNQNKYINFFSSCILVKGIQRGAIYDLQRENLVFVPNTLIDFVNEIKGKKMSDVLQRYKLNKTAKEYLKFLEENEFIFLSGNNTFPDLTAVSRNEDVSEIIFMTIILSEFLYENLDLLIENIKYLCVKRLHIHINDNKCMNKLLKILSHLEYSQVTNLSFSIPSQKINKEIFENERLTSIIIYNAPKKSFEKNHHVNTTYLLNDEDILFITKFKIAHLAININAYNVAKKYNLALYKTIFIDEFGNIKINKSDNTIYGGILSNINIIRKDTISKLEKLWRIGREKISPCNVCEFRYCCTTTFAPLKKGRRYEVTCEYDPYTVELN